MFNIGGLSQFNRLTRVEQITELESVHPTWKDGMLPLHHICIMVTPTGLEPIISGLKGQRLNQFD